MRGNFIFFFISVVLKLSSIVWQIDTNWYEGERNGMVGILPTSYVEILPNESTVCQDIVSSSSSVYLCNLNDMEQES
jgi:hypothetical protein